MYRIATRTHFRPRNVRSVQTARTGLRSTRTVRRTSMRTGPHRLATQYSSLTPKLGLATYSTERDTSIFYPEELFDDVETSKPVQPTEPAPTEPAPTEPAPTEPAPTNPAPNDEPTSPELAKKLTELLSKSEKPVKQKNKPKEVDDEFWDTLQRDIEPETTKPQQRNGNQRYRMQPRGERPQRQHSGDRSSQSVQQAESQQQQAGRGTAAAEKDEGKRMPKESAPQEARKQEPRSKSKPIQATETTETKTSQESESQPSRPQQQFSKSARKQKTQKPYQGAAAKQGQQGQQGPTHTHHRHPHEAAHVPPTWGAMPPYYQYPYYNWTMTQFYPQQPHQPGQPIGGAPPHPQFYGPPAMHPPFGAAPGFNPYFARHAPQIPADAVKALRDATSQAAATSEFHTLCSTYGFEAVARRTDIMAGYLQHFVRQIDAVSLALGNVKVQGKPLTTDEYNMWLSWLERDLAPSSLNADDVATVLRFHIAYAPHTELRPANWIYRVLSGSAATIPTITGDLSEIWLLAHYVSAKPLLKHDEESARIRTMAANQLVSLSVLFKSTNLKHLQSQIYPTILLAELELRHTHNARYILQHMAEDQADLNIYHFAAFQVLLNEYTKAKNKLFDDKEWRYIFKKITAMLLSCIQANSPTAILIGSSIFYASDFARYAVEMDIFQAVRIFAYHCHKKMSVLYSQFLAIIEHLLGRRCVGLAAALIINLSKVSPQLIKKSTDQVQRIIQTALAMRDLPVRDLLKVSQLVLFAAKNQNLFFDSLDKLLAHAAKYPEVQPKVVLLVEQTKEIAAKRAEKGSPKTEEPPKSEESEQDISLDEDVNK